MECLYTVCTTIVLDIIDHYLTRCLNFFTFCSLAAHLCNCTQLIIWFLMITGHFANKFNVYSHFIFYADSWHIIQIRSISVSDCNTTKCSAKRWIQATVYLSDVVKSSGSPKIEYFQLLLSQHWYSKISEILCNSILQTRVKKF